MPRGARQELRGPTVDTVAQLIRDCEGAELTAEQEIALLARRPDRSAVDALVAANVKLLADVARVYSGRGIDLPDLVQIAAIGYMVGIERWDAARGLRLNTFAVHFARGHIKDALRGVRPNEDVFMVEVAEAACTDGTDVAEAVAQLGARHRRVVELLFYSGKTLREAGDIMGVSQSLVHKLRGEAVDELRRLMCGG